jgi:hypothetical protein
MSTGTGSVCGAGAMLSRAASRGRSVCSPRQTSATNRGVFVVVDRGAKRESPRPVPAMAKVPKKLLLLFLWPTIAWGLMSFVPFELFGGRGIWMLLGLGASAVWVWVAWVVVRSRMQRTLKEHAGMVCPVCWYPLKGLERSDRCPECGTARDWLAIRRAWLASIVMDERLRRERFWYEDDRRG